LDTTYGINKEHEEGFEATFCQREKEFDLGVFKAGVLKMGGKAGGLDKVMNGKVMRKLELKYFKNMFREM
jgi:hypothetical protein